MTFVQLCFNFIKLKRNISKIQDFPATLELTEPKVKRMDLQLIAVISDAVPKSDILINGLYGKTPVERWPKAKGIYKSAGCSSQFKLYPGIGHELRYVMKTDIISFFLNNKAK